MKNNIKNRNSSLLLFYVLGFISIKIFSELSSDLLPLLFTSDSGIPNYSIWYILPLTLPFIFVLLTPIIGALSDNTRNTQGRRKPWILFTIIPIFILVPLLSILGALSLYFLVLLFILISPVLIAIPILNVNTRSLFSEMFITFDKRIDANSVIQVAILIMGIIIATIPSYSYPIILRDAPYLFLIYALSFSGVGILCGVLYLQSGIKENEIFLNDSPVSIKKSLSSVIKNKDFLVFLGLNLFISMSDYFGNLLISLPVSFVELGYEKTIFLIALEYILPLSTILFVLVWRKLSNTRDIKNNLKIGILFLILASLPLIYINQYFIFLIVILQSIGRAAFLLYNFVFLSSIIDSSELQTEGRRDGTHFGFYLLIGFLGSIFSSFLYPFINIFNRWRVFQYQDLGTIFNFQTFLEMNLVNFIITLILLVISLLLLQIFSFNTEKIKDIEDQVEKLHREKYEKIQE